MVSKKLFSAMLAILVILAIVASSSVAFAQTQTSTAAAKPTQSIAQIVGNNANFSTLASLLNKTDYASNVTFATVLNGPGNYTLFAPTNLAFAKVPNATLAALLNNTTALKAVLSYYVVQKTLPLASFEGSGTLQTLNPALLPYSVNGTTLKVDNATVTKPDINATNGVIHAIDNVLMPPSTTGAATVSATAGGGFLGLPGFEALYAVAGLLAVAYLVIRRRK